MEGYAKLSDRIAHHPELGIYRRFAALQAQNILYLQAEIHELESDLRELEAENAKKEAVDAAGVAGGRMQFSRNWHRLAHGNATTSTATTTQNDTDRHQWNLFLCLRAKLAEYNSTLIQNAKLTQLYRPPRPTDLAILQHVLSHPSYPDYLLGQDSNIWDDPRLAHDLVVSGPVASASLHSGGVRGDADDGFTEWIARSVVKPAHQGLRRARGFAGRLFSRRKARKRSSTANGDDEATSAADPDPDFEGSTVIEIPEKTIVRIASLVATVISSVFPIVGVIILYFVGDLLARIGIVAGLTASFSLCLALVTDARRGEIFAATAAFSAVLVVFLGAGSTDTSRSAGVD